MGFLDGFLGGVVDRRRQEELQNREDAQNAQVREDAVLQHLSTSDDPEIRALAVAGILDSTHPKRKQGGFGGWLGKVQSNPHMDRIRQLVAHDQEQGKAEAGAATPQPSLTAAPAAGPAGPSLAQASGKSLTEVGAAPPSPTTPLKTGSGDPVEPPQDSSASLHQKMLEPSPGPTPRGQAMQAEALPPGPVPGAPPSSTPSTTVPQTGASAKLVATPPPAGPAGAPPMAVLGQPTPPIGAGPKSPRGDVFRSPETQTRLSKRASAQGDVEGEIAGLVSSGFSEQEALALIKTKMERAARGGVGASGFQSVAGEVMEEETGKKVPTYGAFDKAKGAYIGTDPDSPYYGIPIPGFTPRPTTGNQPRSYGQDREAIAKSKYGVQFKDLDQAQATDVIAEEKKMLSGKAESRGAGAGIAAFNKPIGVGEAQRTNTDVGASSANYAGQQIPSNAEQDVRRGVEGVKGQLEHVKTLIGAALPKAGELAGLVPGATMAIRRRSPQYRTQIAALESALDNVVNVLARTVGQQRGAQTEQDATRAYNTVVSMKARLLDPLAGDTQESAAARIAETMQYLDVVLQKLPATPVAGGVGAATGVGQAPPPTPGAPAGTPPPAPGMRARVATVTQTPTKPGAPKTGGGGPAGYTMVNGVLYKDGKPY